MSTLVSAGIATKQVFISFASANLVTATRLREELESRGVPCYFAPRDVPGGANFAAEIIHAIADSSVLVLLISPASLASPHIRREVTLAIEEGCPILPLLLSGSTSGIGIHPEWRYWLSAVQIIRYTDPVSAADAVLKAMPSVPESEEPADHHRDPRSAPAQPARHDTRFALELSHTDLSADAPPSALLRADADIAPFSGRDEELARISAWISRSDPLLVRLLAAPGGSGKTRLARELCLNYASDGWAAGFLRPNDVARDLLDAASGKGCLAILDYAEVAQSQLKQLITELSGIKNTRIRILLLARNDGDWWTSLKLESHEIEDILALSPPIHLKPIVDSPKAADEFYHLASQAFAAKLRIEPPKFNDARRHNLGENSSALEIQVMALLDLLEAQHGSTYEENESPIARLLNHERRYLRAAMGVDGINIYEIVDVDRILAALSLLGADSEQEAINDIAKVDPYNDVFMSRKMVRLLRRLYPKRQAYTSGLQPDLLAEELIAQVTEGSGQASETPNFPATVLADATEKQLRNALIALGRAASRRDHVMRMLAELLDNLPRDLTLAAFEAAAQLENPGQLTDALRKGIKDTKKDPAVLIEFLFKIPEETAALAEVAADLCERILQIDESVLTALIGPLGDRAHLLRFASNRFSDVGRTQEAARTAQMAVNFMRTRNTNHHEETRVELAAALSSLSNRLWEIGELNAALTPAAEAVSLLTNDGILELSEHADRAVAGACLNNLAFRQADLGDYQPALTTISRAIQVFRDLQQPDDIFVASGLASSLNNFTCINNALGDFQRALTTCDECIRIRRTQAKENRDRFLPNLARALTNAAISHAAVEDHARAIEYGHEAVELQLILAERYSIFAWELIGSGLNLATTLLLAGKRDEAREALSAIIPVTSQVVGSLQPSAAVRSAFELTRHRLATNAPLPSGPPRAIDSRSSPSQDSLSFAPALEYKDL